MPFKTPNTADRADGNRKQRGTRRSSASTFAVRRGGRAEIEALAICRPDLSLPLAIPLGRFPISVVLERVARESFLRRPDKRVAAHIGDGYPHRPLLTIRSRAARTSATIGSTHGLCGSSAGLDIRVFSHQFVGCTQRRQQDRHPRTPDGPAPRPLPRKSCGAEATIRGSTAAALLRSRRAKAKR